MTREQKLSFLVNACMLLYGVQDSDFDTTKESYYANVAASFSALPEAEIDQLYELTRETTVF